MDKPNDKRRPERDPPIISDAEVDRLLSQAQSLTDAIIAEVGVNAIEDREAAPQLGGPEPEPMSAVDLVSHDLAELKETIEEVSPEIQQALLDALAEADAEDGPTAGTKPVSDPAAVTSSEDADEDEMVMSAEMEAALQEALAEAGPMTNATQEVAQAETTVEATEPSGEATEPVASPETRAESPAEAARAVTAEETKAAADAPPESAESKPRRMLRAAAMVLPNAILKTIVVLDRPFAGISGGAKNALGAAGMASLLMGVAAFFMPKLMQSNPYATMEPLPHPAVVEEHGEEGASHEEKPKAEPEAEHQAEPAKEHEEKPAEHDGGHH